MAAGIAHLGFERHWRFPLKITHPRFIIPIITLIAAHPNQFALAEPPMSNHPAIRLGCLPLPGQPGSRLVQSLDSPHSALAADSIILVVLAAWLLGQPPRR